MAGTILERRRKARSSGSAQRDGVGLDMNGVGLQLIMKLAILLKTRQELCVICGDPGRAVKWDFQLRLVEVKQEAWEYGAREGALDEDGSVG